MESDNEPLITEDEIRRAINIFRKIMPTDEDNEFLQDLLRRMDESGGVKINPDELVINEARARQMTKDQQDGK